MKVDHSTAMVKYSRGLSRSRQQNLPSTTDTNAGRVTRAPTNQKKRETILTATLLDAPWLTPSWTQNRAMALYRHIEDEQETIMQLDEYV